jgi:uncharacterized protein with LGFP repeats
MNMTSLDVSHETEDPIHSVYLAYGGAAGVLGLPIGDEEEAIGARSPGRRRHYRGTVHGVVNGISAPAGRHRMASCNRPSDAQGVVESTISWSARTGAHVVHGEIRDLWLQMGAESGDLGYPISSEEPTSDGRGRQSRFEFGEIKWYPESGAVVSSSRPLDAEDPNPVPTADVN